MGTAVKISIEDRRFSALDAFRGIFCVLIVLFHLRVLDAFTRFAPFRNAIIVVAFFFILSGFVLAHRYAYRRELNFPQFIRARFYRIFPLHLFMLSVIVAIECCKYVLQYYDILHFNNPLFAGRMAWKEILANLFLVQAWTPYTEYLSVNYVSWSISVEFYLYLLFFAIQYLCGRAAAVIWLGIAGVTGYCLYYDYPLLVYPAQTGMFCFFSGAVLYSIYRRIAGRSPGKAAASILEILAVLLFLSVLSYRFEYRGVAVVLIFLIMILVFAYEAGVVSRFFTCRAMHFLEKVSYSVYMTHVFTISLVVGVFMAVQRYCGIDCTVMLGDERYLSTGYVWLDDLLVLFSRICHIIIHLAIY